MFCVVQRYDRLVRRLQGQSDRFKGVLVDDADHFWSTHGTGTVLEQQVERYITASPSPDQTRNLGHVLP